MLQDKSVTNILFQQIKYRPNANYLSKDIQVPLIYVIIIIQELCNTTTLEAECSKGEGLEFDFMEPYCVPGYTGWGIGT